MTAVRDRVEPEALGVAGARLDRRGKHPPQHLPAPGRERVGEVRDGALVEDGQRGVQVVVAGIHQLQRDHRAAEVLLSFPVRAGLGPEAGARQDVTPDSQEVAFPLVDVLGLAKLADDLAQPGGVGRGLGSPLGVAKPRTERLAVDHQRRVGGEDHVGETGDAVDDVHAMSQPQIGAAQILPLAQCLVAIDRGRRVHPRVDRVGHVEVRRPAHQVVPGRWGALLPPQRTLARRGGSGVLDQGRGQSVLTTGAVPARGRSLSLFTIDTRPGGETQPRAEYCERGSDSLRIVPGLRRFVAFAARAVQPARTAQPVRAARHARNASLR